MEGPGVEAPGRSSGTRLSIGVRRRAAAFLHPGEGGGLNPGLVAALVILFVVLAVWSPVFLTSTNLLNIGKAVAIVGIVAVGETIVIISGGFDLSVGSVMAAAGMLAAYLVAWGVPLPLAFAAAIALGIAIGLVNGAIVSYARINPLITTLATLAIVRGIAYVVSGGRERVIDNQAWLSLGTGAFLGIPYLIIVLGATFLVFGLLMPRTLFGRYAYAIGSNVRAARLAGVAVNRWRLVYYVVCGGLAALAGLMLVARTGSAQPTAALGIELDVITAVILGGTSLTGGRGLLAGTLVALLIIGIVNNGLTLLGVPAYWQGIVKGAILLAAVVYDELRRPRRDEM
jgi:ribose/xylose/arabinose/galactoside ABC-type transport system permease subunit